MNRLKRHEWIRVNAALVAAILLLPAGAAWAQGRPATPVRVERLKLEELQEQRRVTGELRAVARSKVATIEPGLVAELPVQEGDVVQKGDVLAVLDSRRLALAGLQLEAESMVARAQIEVRKAEHQREVDDLATLEALDARRASNPKELGDARVDLQVAVARLQEAERDLDVIQARLEIVNTRLKDKTIVAPFDGIVLERLTEVGQWLGEGDVIADVVAVGRYEAWLEIPQRYAASVMGKNRGVQVRVDASSMEVPVLQPRVVPLVDPRARMFSAYVTIDDEAGALAPGMSVTGWIPTGERQEYLTVDRDAILRNEAGFYVYVAKETPGGPTMASPTPVTYLFTTADRIAIRSAQLGPDAVVVIEGNERLFPMMPIAPVFDPPDGSAGATTNAGEGG